MRSASTVPSTPPPTGASASGSSSTENSPNIDGERGDLIEFYNKVLSNKILCLKAAFVLHNLSNYI